MSHVANGIVIGWAGAAVVTFIVGLLWALTDPSDWGAWRETMRRPPRPDPTYRSTPADRAPDAPPRASACQ